MWSFSVVLSLKVFSQYKHCRLTEQNVSHLLAPFNSASLNRSPVQFALQGVQEVAAEHDVVRQPDAERMFSGHVVQQRRPERQDVELNPNLRRHGLAGAPSPVPRELLAAEHAEPVEAAVVSLPLLLLQDLLLRRSTG